MSNIKLCLIVFVCTAVVLESNAGYQMEDTDPCDTCPYNGKCVPKVSCPAHVRPGSKNPECHLESGHIGICCYTGHNLAAKNERKSKARSNERKEAYLKKAHNFSKSRMKQWCEWSRNVLKYSDNTVVCPDSPDNGHYLTVGAIDYRTDSIGDGGLLNLFATEELYNQNAFDDEEVAVGYGEVYEGPYCPPQPACPYAPSPYRSFNGECNNPDHPTWGAANTGYERLLPPDYSDGIWAMRTSKCRNCSGKPLPSPRDISVAMLLEGHHPSDKMNMMGAQLGQFIAHDTTSGVAFSHDNGSAISCCANEGGCLPPEQLHYACAPVAVSPRDEFYSKFNITCLNFVRTQLAPSPDCSCGYAKQMNEATHFLDLSHLYGKTKEKQNQLRAPGGYLKVFNDYGRYLMPLTDRPECLNRMKESPCFNSGDNNGNQHVALTFYHTIFTREHNRIAGELTRLNPGCDDNTIFHTAKAILVAMFQHIVYNEWLPHIIGPRLMEMHKLAATCDGYARCYDPTVNPSVLSEFAAAAFRLHSIVPSNIKVGCVHSDAPSELISLSETMQEPSRMRKRHFMDLMAKGIMSQPCERLDPYVTFGLTRYMFRAGNAFGLDIATLNIQRGRDHGLRSYNDYRELCGFPKFRSIDDFSRSVRERVRLVYDCADDIDLWIGGLLELPEKDALLGATFACIVAEQFTRFKNGDRFYYEHGPENNPGAFTPRQLAAIKNTKFAHILCKNLDKFEISSVPPNAFLRSDLPGNKPIQCNDPTIPYMDLSCFKIV